MIAAIVLSVLLIMSVTAGATLAWFASRDRATSTLTMGEAVVVTIGTDYKQGDGSLAMKLPVDQATGKLLPGMSITPNIKVNLQKSNTNALLRARFITTVEYPQNYMDAAFSDTAKYPTGSELPTGKVLADYNVYSGTIQYDYYTSTGAKDETKSHAVTLDRVEVRSEIAALVDASTGTTKGDWTINGVPVPVTSQNAAELEIRQRGVDLTNAINRVLAGQRGYGIDPSTGAVVDDPSYGVKYTRRVANGWAYRAADQAWYYLGSQTNGYYLASDSADSTEELPETPVSAIKDIAKYDEVTADNVTVYKPDYDLLSEDTNPYKTTVTENGTNKNDMTRNYLGGTAKDESVDWVRNEIAVLNQETIASVDLSVGDVSIDFLTKRFVLPTFINNNYAQADVTFTFTVEAVQDYLVDPLQEATSAADRLPNNLVNAILVFNNAFPQAYAGTAGAAALAATGATANAVPGGGIVSQTAWDTTDGTSTVVQVSGATMDKDNLYSYGYIDDTTLTGTAYSFNDYTKAGSFAEGTGWTWPQGTAKSGIKGFKTRIDDYGDYVADYTAPADYQRGTASSLGISPTIAAQRTTPVMGTAETPAAGGGA